VIVLGLDPGPEITGWFVWDSESRRGVVHGYDPNETVLSILREVSEDERVVFACEQVVSYGMPVGASVFEMCVWMGRFWQVVDPRPFHMVSNSAVRAHLCRTHKAKDANVKAALIEKFGPVGTKKKPGPFYGVSGHVWSAAGVAVTYADQQAAKEGRA